MKTKSFCGKLCGAWLLAAAASASWSHPGNGLVVLASDQVLTGDAVHNGLWLFTPNRTPQRLLDRFHCHWVTKGLDGHIYAETLGESGGAWKSAVHRLKQDGSYDRSIESRVDAIHGVFLVDEKGGLVYWNKGRVVCKRDRSKEVPFRGSGLTAKGVAPLKSIKAMAWGPGGFLWVSDGARILSAGRDGVFRLYAALQGAPTNALYAAPDGKNLVWSLAVSPAGTVFAAVPSMGAVVKVLPNKVQQVVHRAADGWAVVGLSERKGSLYLLESKTTESDNYGPRVRKLSRGSIFDFGTVQETE